VIRVGVATLSIARQFADRFPAEGTGLERYASRLNATEINSSFYRSHQRKTYERWAATAPPGFRFSVKVPKTITHERRLTDVEEPLDRFLGEATGLGDKLGPLLVQLPPSFKFDAQVAARFFHVVRARHGGFLAVEPRHATWFTDEADALLVEVKAARVLADPALVPEAAAFGGWPGLAYARLHGSPRLYYSPYGRDALVEVARKLRAARAEQAWCILDNTTSGAALGDALTLQEMLS
jgi:uncharacterized protein YecE (DUF72 family)